jgi:hypothetical protein
MDATGENRKSSFRALLKRNRRVSDPEDRARGLQDQNLAPASPVLANNPADKRPWNLRRTVSASSPTSNSPHIKVGTSSPSYSLGSPPTQSRIRSFLKRQTSNPRLEDSSDYGSPNYPLPGFPDISSRHTYNEHAFQSVVSPGRQFPATSPSRPHTEWYPGQFSPVANNPFENWNSTSFAVHSAVSYPALSPMLSIMDEHKPLPALPISPAIQVSSYESQPQTPNPQPRSIPYSDPEPSSAKAFETETEGFTSPTDYALFAEATSSIGFMPSAFAPPVSVTPPPTEAAAIFSESNPSPVNTTRTDSFPSHSSRVESFPSQTTHTDSFPLHSPLSPVESAKTQSFPQTSSPISPNEFETASLTTSPTTIVRQSFSSLPNSPISPPPVPPIPSQFVRHPAPALQALRLLPPPRIPRRLPIFSSPLGRISTPDLALIQPTRTESFPTRESSLSLHPVESTPPRSRSVPPALDISTLQGFSLDIDVITRRPSIPQPHLTAPFDPYAPLLPPSFESMPSSPTLSSPTTSQGPSAQVTAPTRPDTQTTSSRRPTQTSTEAFLRALEAIDAEELAREEEDLPDYAQSQAEAHMQRREAATRRARELEEGWRRGRAERSGGSGGRARASIWRGGARDVTRDSARDSARDTWWG